MQRTLFFRRFSFNLNWLLPDIRRAGRLALLLVGFAGLAGCIPEARYPVLEKDGPEFTASEFEPICQINGMLQAYTPVNGILRWWRIVSAIDKRTGAITNYLWFQLEYDSHGFLNYRSARDDTSQSWPVRVERKNHLSCSRYGECGYEEVLNVPVTEAKLRASVSSGLRIKLFSESGDDLVFEFLPEQISKQLMVVDKSTNKCQGLRSTPEAAASGNASSSGIPGRFGVRFVPVDPAVLSMSHVPSDHGLVIGKIDPETPAARAGLTQGDVLLEFEGLPLKERSDLLAAVAGVPAGGKARVHFWRNGGLMDVEVQF